MRVAFVITPNMLATSLTNAYELLFAANQASKTLENLRGPVTEQLELVKLAQSDQRTTLASGLSLQPDNGLLREKFDMVYLPALWRNPRPIVRQHTEIVDWLQWQFEQGAIINSTGTGVCFTAEAGLLDNKPATTHWYYFDQFAKDYPQVQLKRQHFITTAGKIYCAASINALTDLTLHHVHRFFGAEVAAHLSRHFSHEIRQPFDMLNFNAEDDSNHSDETILQAQLWMENHLDQSQHGNAPISLRKLAELFGMSQRNFTRRFKAATNLTPKQYLQNRRLTTAKELLQSSRLTIKEIAYRVGYHDVSYFTQLFRKFTSITPKEYRTTVRAR